MFDHLNTDLDVYKTEAISAQKIFFFLNTQIPTASFEVRNPALTLDKLVDI